MKPIIDERGNLFGVVNIIDALVVLLLVAVMTAGVALVSESMVAPLGAIGLGVIAIIGLVAFDGEVKDEDNQEQQSQQIQLRISKIEPAVAEAIAVGDTSINGELVVNGVQKEPASVVVDTEDGTLVEQTHPRLLTVTLIASLHSGHQDTDDFRGDRLYVGRELQVDLDKVRVDATIVGFDDELPAERTLEQEDIGSSEAVSVSVAE